MKFFATIAKNLEPLLVEELVSLGQSNVKQAAGGAHFEGTLRDAYKVCLWSRLANAVLMPLHTCDAPTPEALYDGVRKVRWQKHMSVDGTLAVDFTSSGSQITHTHYGALKVKDAIVDQFRDKYGRRPSVDTRSPDLRINVHVRRDVATISVDLSGASLHRRGWRLEQGKAPLKENVAAAILWRAGWPEMAEQGAPFIDPMCGSGTFPIEAWLMAANIAPGLFRKDGFGFQTWRQHDEDMWQELLEEARRIQDDALQRDYPHIIGYDKDHHVIRQARANAHACGVQKFVRLSQREVREVRSGDTPGLMCVNPPYGERLEDEPGAMLAHERLGDTLIESFFDWHVYLLTGSKELGFAIPLRARKRYTVYNGPLECSLLHFEVLADRIYIPKNQEEGE